MNLNQHRHQVWAPETDEWACQKCGLREKVRRDAKGRFWTRGHFSSGGRVGAGGAVPLQRATVTRQ